MHRLPSAPSKPRHTVAPGSKLVIRDAEAVKGLPVYLLHEMEAVSPRNKRQHHPQYFRMLRGIALHWNKDGQEGPEAGVEVVGRP